jgi:hypothetical protein
MTKLKNQAVKLSNVVVLDSKALTAIADGENVKVDGRHNNTGRPVNKQSARYKRLAKQAKYERVLNKFTQGCSFKLNKEKSQLFKYSIDSGESYGVLVSAIGGYVCNIDYIGRTKVTGYTFVLDKKVNVELNLKTLVFVE